MTLQEILQGRLGINNAGFQPMKQKNGRPTGMMIHINDKAKLYVMIRESVWFTMDISTRNDLEMDMQMCHGYQYVFIKGLNTIVEKPTQSAPKPKDGTKEWNAFFGEDQIIKEPSNEQFRRYAADAFPKQRYKF